MKSIITDPARLDHHASLCGPRQIAPHLALDVICQLQRLPLSFLGLLPGSFQLPGLLVSKLPASPIVTLFMQPDIYGYTGSGLLQA